MHTIRIKRYQTPSGWVATVSYDGAEELGPTLATGSSWTDYSATGHAVRSWRESRAKRLRAVRRASATGGGR